jgi:NAD(P)-dependent dehydrogenase (short-subunit alcohol dehydrogenase family)
MAHAALAPGRVGVLLGAAGGIGLAMAKKCAKNGMKLVLADIDADDLEKAKKECCPGNEADVITKVTDVSKYEDVLALKDLAYNTFGEVGFLFSNAGIMPDSKSYSGREGWEKVINVNLWGVINTTQAFTQSMIDQNTECLIVNTGSKQGITAPPGNTGYNVSKAGVKTLTEGLQHDLRSLENCKVSAALLIPGWTNTEILRRKLVAANNGQPVNLENVFFCEEKPANGAWMPDQVVDYFFQRIAEKHESRSFYIVCPDNDVTEATDRKRMEWSAGDIVKERPPLSRWHPACKDEFEKHMAS